MNKEPIVTEIIMSMQNRGMDVDYSVIKECLQSVLYKYDFSPIETSVATLSEQNNTYFLKLFMADMIAEGKSKKTIAQYIRSARTMLETVGKDFREVTKEDITIYILELGRRGLTNSSIDNERKFVKAFFNWAVFNDYLQSNPFLKIKGGKRNPIKKEILTDIEIEIIKDACVTNRERALIDFLISTGVRISECETVLMSNINLENGECRIFAHKTSEWRMVYLDARALKHLCDYRAELQTRGRSSEYVFLAKHKDERLQKYGIQSLLKEIISRTSITRKVTVHTFRKTLASKLTKKGMRPEYVAMILGHKNFATTQRYYASIDQSDIHREFNRCIG